MIDHREWPEDRSARRVISAGSPADAEGREHLIVLYWDSVTGQRRAETVHATRAELEAREDCPS